MAYSATPRSNPSPSTGQPASYPTSTVPQTVQQAYHPMYAAYQPYAAYPQYHAHVPASVVSYGMSAVPMSGPIAGAPFSGDASYSPPDYGRAPRYAGTSQHAGQHMGTHPPPPPPPPQYSYTRPQYGQVSPPRYAYGEHAYQYPPVGYPYGQAAPPMQQPSYGVQSYASATPEHGEAFAGSQVHGEGQRAFHSNPHHQRSQRGVPRGSFRGRRFESRNGRTSITQTFQHPPPPKPQTNGEQASKRKKTKKIKKEGNALGLTPHVDADGIASASEDDEDEEVILAGKDGVGEGLAFEHKGQAFDLSSHAELAAWLEERKRNYPTKARAEARAANPQHLLSGSNSIHIGDSHKRKRENGEDQNEVPQSKKAKQAPIQGQECLQFRDQAVCMRGKRCFYIHKMPDGSVVNSETLGNPRSGALRSKRAAEERSRKPRPGPRKSLFEIMREAEQKEEDEFVVRAIKELGDLGFFKDTKSLDIVMLAAESVNRMTLGAGPTIEVLEENGVAVPAKSAVKKTNGVAEKERAKIRNPLLPHWEPKAESGDDLDVDTSVLPPEPSGDGNHPSSGSDYLSLHSHASTVGIKSDEIA